MELTNEIPISKYQLLMLIKDIFRIENLEIKKDKEKKINMSLKSVRKVDFSIPNYEQMITDLFHYFNKNEMNYNYQK